MEWKEVRLGDVCTRVCSGGTPKSTNLSYYGGEIPWLNTKEIDFNRIYSTEKTITDSGLNNSSAKWIVPNTVTVAMYGATAGKSCIVKVPMTTNQACCNLTINDEVADYEFIYYSLKNDYTTLASLANGGAQQNLNAQIIKDYVLKMPSLADQRRITSILSSLDRKIELNNKINADLEEMAQAIFKNWFVDFEPFKDGKFVDSELGMIPEGWKVGTIGDIVEFQNGFTFSSKDFSENGEYKIITIKSVQDGCLVTEGSSKVTEYPTKMPAYCKLQSGDILLSLTGNVGRCCLVTETNLLLNQRVAKIKAKECYDNSFSYALFRLKETKELLISISRGTAQANLSPVEASKLPMVIPSEDARKSFSMISDSIMNKIISIHIENSRISLLRDTLLPRLMSGELEVPE